MGKKNKDKTFIEIMEECIHHSKEALWNYATALRGPDIIVALGQIHIWLKTVFTYPLRGQSIVEEYLVSGLKDIEGVFEYLNNEKHVREYFHYLNHIAKYGTILILKLNLLYIPYSVMVVTSIKNKSRT